MSQSTNDIPKAAIVATKTNNDVIAAITNDPDLQNALKGGVLDLLNGNKAMFQSKTFWMALLMPVATALVAHFGLALDGDTVKALVGLMSLAAANMIGMRAITKTPISGVVTSKGPTP